MPALVCIYCRTTWRPGTTPVSHGICPGCLLATDPEAFAEVYLAGYAHTGGALEGHDHRGTAGRHPDDRRD
jgi:hypothetical protein